MRAIGTTFDGAVAPRSGDIASGIWRIRRAALQLLDRLVPPRGDAHDSELPPEFFKYPPM
jgi:hypothetical protein